MLFFLSKEIRSSNKKNNEKVKIEKREWNKAT
jgi:hypothetical protein